jgi:hypothetical protein
MAVAVHLVREGRLLVAAHCEDIMTANRPPTSSVSSSLVLRIALAMSAAAFVMTGAVVVARAPQGPAALGPQVQERTFPIPSSLLQEHAELHTALETASRLSGDTGVAARRVLALVTPHFKDEERRVFPLLKLLPMLGAEQAEPWMAELLPVADRLRTDIDAMRRAHVTIATALDGLSTAAWREGHPEYAFLADRIRHHEQMEQEIFYPAALLVGDCLRVRFPARATASLR